MALEALSYGKRMRIRERKEEIDILGMVQARRKRLPLLSPSSLHSSETSENTGISVLLPASQYISAQSLITSVYLPYAFCITGGIWQSAFLQKGMVIIERGEEGDIA